MYGMSIYQAPQVPQPAVTFGGGNYVDLSTVNMLQAQNAALQQENVALKSANQSLQQQRENPICKAANRAYLREFTAYKTESLVEFPDGRIYGPLLYEGIRTAKFMCLFGCHLVSFGLVFCWLTLL